MILGEADGTVVLRQLHGKSLYTIVALALATGMRRGELLALTWRNVDLDGARLRVDGARLCVEQLY
jgi:integrase